MSTPDLPDLLRRWADAEPERCRIAPTREDLGYVLTLDGAEYLVRRLDAYGRLMVQGALQEAIRARGRRIDLRIHVDGPVYATTADRNTLFAKCGGDEATALLLAHLSDLEDAAPPERPAAPEPHDPRPDDAGHT